MKRFYKLVTTAETQNGWEIHLDGKPVLTPGRNRLLAPTQAMADAMMAEWAAQTDMIVPDSMPITQILTTALEHVASNRPAMTHTLLGYLNTDLICYRTTHEQIAERQIAAWDPWLIWFMDRFDVQLAVTDRLQALTQPAEAQAAVRDRLEAWDDYHFAVAQLVASLCGSLVLGLAFTEGALSPTDAFQAANIDEIYKGELYGEDFYGKAPQQEQRDLAMQRDLEASEQFLKLLG